MSKEKLTKETVREANGLQLIRRLNYLYAKNNDQHRDAGIPITDIQEASAISKELKRRLNKIWGLFFKGGKK